MAISRVFIITYTIQKAVSVAMDAKAQSSLLESCDAGWGHSCGARDLGAVTTAGISSAESAEHASG